MARYVLLAAIVGAPPNGVYSKYPRGTTIADSAGNALSGDVVWPALCQAPTAANMAPLDAAGQALMPTRPPIVTLNSPLPPALVGGAAGEAAGS
jgi:hypothetical protein